MQKLIQEILEKYPSARATTSFGGSHEIQKLFLALKQQVTDLPFVKGNQNLVVKTSYGKGNWAAVPWLAILDSRETDTTQDGTYIVLLFREDGKGCHLKLAQGVTELRKTMGDSRAAAELTRRASEIRDQFPHMQESGFDIIGAQRLETENKLARLYESSSIFSKYWEQNFIPLEKNIETDIEKLVNCYGEYISTHLNEMTDDAPLVHGENRIWAIAAGTSGELWPEFISSKEVAIGWDFLGDLTVYRSQEDITKKIVEHFQDGRKPTNDSLCCFQFAKEIQVGDILVAKTGRKKVWGAGIVESDYIFDAARAAFKNIRKVRWLKTEPAELPGTGTTTKTLTEITAYPTFVEFVRNYLGDLHPTAPDSGRTPSVEPYSIDNIIEDGCFLDRAGLEQLIDRLRIKKNLILQGPPGTGKTWLAKRLAYALIGQVDYQRMRAVQFHPNLSYEDFVRGWRPSGDGKLSLVDGAFMDAVEDARNTSRPYVVVIEEINRGNPAQIFGELLTLLEADKRNSQEGLELCYRRSANERVYIPPNLYVIGTMNIADRSLALVDLALRRRFAFASLEPTLNQSWRNWLINRGGVDPSIVSEIEKRISHLNANISDDSTLGPQFRIGHSYVTPPVEEPIGDAREWFRQVVSTEIGPLLDEYWFDSLDKSRAAQRDLVEGF